MVKKAETKRKQRGEPNKAQIKAVGSQDLSRGGKSVRNEEMEIMEGRGRGKIEDLVARLFMVLG